ncbi:hypothetical protein [Nocardia vaccinii]|uniref:hypothetical protein n=1 Tax=Nocardia vaccinii TaxID=1822 RepID=UPI00082FAB23|nr:hypothetical protein [Nocardia vaccinii]
MRVRGKIAIVVILVTGAVAGFAYGLGTSKHGSTHEADTWSVSVKMTTSSGTGITGRAYKLSVATPEFSGIADARAMRAVNAMFQDRTRKEIDGLTTATDQNPPTDDFDGNAPFTLTESVAIQRIGRIAAVAFSGDEYIGGAHGFPLAESVLIRTDTWTAIPADQSFLATAGTAEGATKLAGVIAPSIKGAPGDSCHTDAASLLAGGPSSSGTVTPDSFEHSMVVGLWPGGVEFIFSPYRLWAFGCGQGIARVPFSALDGLINPGIVRLATSS